MDIEPEKIYLDSGGSKLSGWFFRCNVSTSPLVVLLHGYPGSKQDPLGLGSLISKAKINVITFNYRGTWDSEGFFSYDNCIDDILSVTSFLYSSKLSQKLHVEPLTISYVGYSFGAGAVLIASTRDPRIWKIAVLAPLNLGEFGRQLLENENLKAFHEKTLDETMGKNGMARGPGGKKIHLDIINSIDKNDLFEITEKLIEKDLLIIGGEQDEDLPFNRHIIPLYTKLKKCDVDVSLEVLNTDHYFTGVEKQVADSLILWLN